MVGCVVPYTVHGPQRIHTPNAPRTDTVGHTRVNAHHTMDLLVKEVPERVVGALGKVAVLVRSLGGKPVPACVGATSTCESVAVWRAGEHRDTLGRLPRRGMRGVHVSMSQTKRNM